jgi:hypothetical protein
MKYVCPWCKFESEQISCNYSYGDEDYVEYISCSKCGSQIGYTNYYFDDRKYSEDNGVFNYLDTNSRK